METNNNTNPNLRMLITRLSKIEIKDVFKKNVQYFVFGYRNLFSPKALLNELKIYFMDEKSVEREKSMNIMKMWNRYTPSDFNINTLDPKEIKEMERLISKKLVFNHDDENKNDLQENGVDTFIKKTKISKWDANKVAQQISLMIGDNYYKIDPIEFGKKMWDKSNKSVNGKNIIEMINRFNHIAFWVVTEIIKTRNKRQYIEFFIKVANECFMIKNFEGMGAIIAGLNNSSIQSMKTKWEKLSELSLQMFKHMESILSPQMNFANYRKHFLEAKTSKMPHFPYLAVHLKDMTYSQENYDFSNEDNLDIYLETLSNGKQIYNVLRPQHHKYKFYQDKFIYNYIKCFKNLSSEQLTDSFNNISGNKTQHNSLLSKLNLSKILGTNPIIKKDPKFINQNSLPLPLKLDKKDSPKYSFVKQKSFFMDKPKKISTKRNSGSNTPRNLSSFSNLSPPNKPKNGNSETALEETKLDERKVLYEIKNDPNLSFIFESSLKKNMNTANWLFWLKLTELIDGEFHDYTLYTKLETIKIQHINKSSPEEVSLDDLFRKKIHFYVDNKENLKNKKQLNSDLGMLRGQIEKLMLFDLLTFQSKRKESATNFENRSRPTRAKTRVSHSVIYETETEEEINNVQEFSHESNVLHKIKNLPIFCFVFEKELKKKNKLNAWLLWKDILYILDNRIVDTPTLYKLIDELYQKYFFFPFECNIEESLIKKFQVFTQNIELVKNRVDLDDILREMASNIEAVLIDNYEELSKPLKSRKKSLSDFDFLKFTNK